MMREIRGDDHQLLQEVADFFEKSGKVLVVTGAGISTSCGVPDFRSKGGLYDMVFRRQRGLKPSTELQTVNLNIQSAPTFEAVKVGISPSPRTQKNHDHILEPTLKGRDLFDCSVLRDPDSAALFYQAISTLRNMIHNKVLDTSPTHKFIKVLRDGGRLARCYTQNIDGLEAREGLCTDLSFGVGESPGSRVREEKLRSLNPDQHVNVRRECEVVQLHGELSRLRCNFCETEIDWTKEASELLQGGKAPKCGVCKTRSENRQASNKRKLAVGTLRPNVVLYGEDHPQDILIQQLIAVDLQSSLDILLIMGTSLKVFGIQRLIKDFARVVHRHSCGRVIFVNRTRPAGSIWADVVDDFLAVDCDMWISDLKDRCPRLWRRPMMLDEGAEQVRVRKDSPPLSNTERPIPDASKEGIVSSDMQDELWLEAYFPN